MIASLFFLGKTWPAGGPEKGQSVWIYSHMLHCTLVSNRFGQQGQHMENFPFGSAVRQENYQNSGPPLSAIATIVSSRRKTVGRWLKTIVLLEIQRRG
jgi:hypothetical protein